MITIEQNTADYFFKPRVPAFPDLLTMAGRWASWFSRFCRWIGFPMGPVELLTSFLSLKSSQVVWARASLSGRLAAVTLIPLGGIIALNLLKKSGVPR